MNIINLVVLGLVFELLASVIELIAAQPDGELITVCQDFSTSSECTSDQCQWVDNSACVCVEDSDNIDVWFLLESSNISHEIWTYLMLQLAADYIEYVKAPDTNVYVMRFGDDTTEVLSNPSASDVTSWSRGSETKSSVCDALSELEANLAQSSRSSLVVTVFGNGIDDADDGTTCSTSALSADIVYGLLDSSRSSEFEFLNYDGFTLMDFSTTEVGTIQYFENYVLSAVSDFACVLDPAPTAGPSPAPTGTTASPTREYVPYVNYVYRRSRPQRIGPPPGYDYGPPPGYGAGNRWA